MNKIKWLGLVIFISILGASCSKNDVVDNSSLYIPSSSDVTAKATLDELTQGRQLYIDNCGRCHGLYSPDDYSPSDWTSILRGMAPRTPMTSSEIQLVTKYVTRGSWNEIKQEKLIVSILYRGAGYQPFPVLDDLKH